MHKLAIAVVTVLALAGAAFAQEPAASAYPDMQDLFPRPQEVAGWAISYDVETYPGEKIYDFINGAGEIFMQYNFEVAASAEYAGPGEGAIAVEAYRHATAEDAYGVYMYHRPQGAETVNLPQRAFVSGSTGGLWKGPYYVKVYVVQEAEGAAAAIPDFLRVISNRIEREGNLPDFFRVFDVEGYQEGTVRFTRTWLPLKNLHFVSEDNVLNLGKDTRFAFADYSLRGRDFQAWLAVYPTEAAAEAAAAKYAIFLGAGADAEAAWFKQTGKAIVGAWTGLKVAETLDSQDVIYETMQGILEKVRIYQLDK